jgi:MoaA/NifB/PqqE/SkfB family radical SAM enzyme
MAQKPFAYIEPKSERARNKRGLEWLSNFFLQPKACGGLRIRMAERPHRTLPIVSDSGVRPTNGVHPGEADPPPLADPTRNNHAEPHTLPEIGIWYLSNLQRCNFTCSYCASGQPVLQQSETLPTWANGIEVHEQIVNWLIAQPFTLRLRMNSIGEPFVSVPYLESVARLSHAANVSFVEILTNGSFRPAQFDRFSEACNVNKLSLWITFHHQFISPAELVSAAAHAQARGAFVVVNALLFPDNVDAVSELIERCEKHELRVSTGIGINQNNAYAGQGYAPALRNPQTRALELANYRNPLGDYHKLSTKPGGKPCRAGTRYFFIDAQGTVFPCLTYSLTLKKNRLGSVQDPQFRLPTPSHEYTTCVASGRCFCPEDYQNLESIQGRFSWPMPSFGLPVPDRTVV